jgi:hypothetical protein
MFGEAFDREIEVFAHRLLDAQGVLDRAARAQSTLAVGRIALERCGWLVVDADATLDGRAQRPRAQLLADDQARGEIPGGGGARVVDPEPGDKPRAHPRRPFEIRVETGERALSGRARGDELAARNRWLAGLEVGRQA